MGTPFMLGSVEIKKDECIVQYIHKIFSNICQNIKCKSVLLFINITCKNVHYNHKSIYTRIIIEVCSLIKNWYGRLKMTWDSLIFFLLRRIYPPSSWICSDLWLLCPIESGGNDIVSVWGIPFKRVGIIHFGIIMLQVVL